MTTPGREPSAGDRVTMRLGESVVHGTVQRSDHGGASLYVYVDGFEQHAMWFASPPWTVSPPARETT